MDGCTALLSTNSSITYEGDTTSQLVFDQMLNMTKLSIQNCTALTQDIDVTLNTNLLTLDMSGTTINAILPISSKLTTLEFGTPTTINVDTPASLTTSGIKVDSSTNISSLTLVNMPNSSTFNSFAKIMNI